MKSMTHLGFAVALGLLSLPVAAQNQTPSNSQDQSSSESSLGSYARQVRKDNGVKNKPKVYDNDNLPTEDKLSVVGEKTDPGAADANASNEPAAASSNEPKAEADGKPGEAGKGSGANLGPKPPSTSPDDDPATREAAWKQWQDRISKQKDQIDLLARELDVVQREYQLRAAAFYADAGNRMRNEAAWDKEDASYKQQIADKQKALDDAKQQLDDIQEDARKSGVPASSREPQQTEQQPQQQ